MPPPKLCVFSTAIAVVETRYGPESGLAIFNGSLADRSPLFASQVRVVIPLKTAPAPNSALTI